MPNLVACYNNIKVERSNAIQNTKDRDPNTRLQNEDIYIYIYISKNQFI
jgi:hypothetical protein